MAEVQSGQLAKTELDRRLDAPHSTLAERCWAVAGYAGLLQDKPTASVCNSAFLKLADVFEKTPDNVLRFAVVNVMERCRSQLVRVFNTDILVQKVHGVLEKSIDPVARALALRALASMAQLLVHNQRVHSDVRNALRSPNSDEQASCVLCVQHFSELSASFAQGSISLIGRLVLALETPMARRLQLIATLHHMHQDPTSVLQSRAVLEDVMQRYPLAPVVELCLRTSSSLAIRSRMRIDDQIQILLDTLQEDCRESVQLEAAKSLSRVLRIAPSSGSEALAMRMLEITGTASLREDDGSSGACFGILVMLARSDTLSARSGVVIERLTAMLSPPHPARSRKLAATVFAVLLGNHVRSGACASPVTAHVVKGSSSVKLRGALDDVDGVEQLALQLTESACDMLGETDSLAAEDIQLMDALLALLSLSDGQDSGRLDGMEMPGRPQTDSAVGASGRKLLQCLRLLLLRTRQAGDPDSLLFAGIDRLNVACSTLLPDTMIEAQEAVVTMARQERAKPRPQGTGGDAPTDGSLQLIKSLLMLGQGTRFDQVETVRGVEAWCVECLNGDPWMGYRLARWALVLGYHDLAATLLRLLVPNTQSTSNTSWMEALLRLAEAEDCASSASGHGVAVRGGGLASAMSKLQEALILMRVVAPRPTEMRLQQRFIEARLRSFDAIVGMRAAAWDWLELFGEDFDAEQMNDVAMEAGCAVEEAVAVVQEAVAEMEAAAHDIRNLGRWRFGTDATSRISLDQWACNLSFCGKVARVLLLSYPLHSLFWDDGEAECDGAAGRRFGGEGGAGAARTLRERLRQWVCEIVGHVESGALDSEACMADGEPTLSGLHRVQALLEVIHQVGTLPLRLPPVVLDASPPLLLDLRITPKPRGVLETRMGVGLVLTLEGTLFGSPQVPTKDAQRRRDAQGGRDVACVSRVLLSVTVGKVCEHSASSSGTDAANSPNAAPADSGAGGTSKEMRFKLRCRGHPGSVYTTCLLSWPTPGTYLVSIVPKLIDAKGEQWDGGPATHLRVKVSA